MENNNNNTNTNTSDSNSSSNNNNNNNRKRHFKKPQNDKASSSTNNNNNSNKPRHVAAKEMSKRELELIQLETRYKSSYRLISETEQETVIRLAIKPSDPDFPYEMVALQIQIHVPKGYPSDPCSLDVLNTDIPKGFAINLEKGYLERVNTSTVHQTLVRQMNWLDRNMESLLQQAPAPTVRFVSNQQRLSENTAAEIVPVTLPNQRQPQQNVSKKEYTRKQPIKKEIVTSSPSSSTAFLPQQLIEPQQHQLELQKQQEQSASLKHTFTQEQADAAAKRRRHEFRQLQTRFCDTFKTLRTNQQETVASFILNVNDPEFTHEQMMGGRELYIKYHIPVLYPLDPCSIEIDNKGLDKTRASWIIQAFDQQVKNGTYNLFENLNWLNRHLEQLLQTPPTHKSEEQREVDAIAAAQQKDLKPPVVQRPLDSTSTLSPNAPLFTPKKKKTSLFEEDTRKNRVVIVNDPSIIRDQDDEEQQAAEEEVEVELANDDQDGALVYNEQPGSSVPVTTPTMRRGTEVRLMDPVLENITLFRCAILHVVVKCNRCKETVDIENVHPETDDKTKEHSKERWLACPTCSSVIGIRFLGDFVHQGSKSIGLLQLAGCTAFDLLPSHYTGACGSCMADMTNTLRLSAHDSPQSVNCFSCHVKMTIGLNDYRFVLLGQAGERLKADEEQVMKLKKKKKRGLGLTIGEPLPDQGTCSHYRKSKRWFRFICCNKLHACDVCHDSHEDHPYEMARRHVCGMCSRESQIQPGKPCSCGHEFEHTTGKGAFWEGGKGVRDKVKMSRKDPHKHKGIGKTTSKKQDRVGTAGKERIKQQTE